MSLDGYNPVISSQLGGSLLQAKKGSFKFSFTLEIQVVLGFPRRQV